MRKGWAILKQSFRIFFRHPSLLLPLILFWMAYAPSLLYLKYYFPWGQYSQAQKLGIVFSYVVFLSVSICLSCTILLELLQQLENRKELSFFGALGDAISRDFLKVLPVASVFAVLWFALAVLASLTKKNKNDGKNDLTPESAARTLAGTGEFSFSLLFVEAAKKGIRMIVFLILPGIAFDDLSTKDSVKKGFYILRNHLKEFATGYALTSLASTVIFVPALIMLELGKKGKNGSPPLVTFSDNEWMGLIAYIGIAWSISIYLEQMFGASLYLWHVKWEKMKTEARQLRLPEPTFENVPPPTLLKTMPEMQKFVTGKDEIAV